MIVESRNSGEGFGLRDFLYFCHFKRTTTAMELYEALNKRRTVREFLDKEIDFEAIKRILEAGNMAPS